MDVKAGHTISWSIQPHKKPINFGIFKHPGSGIAPTPKAPTSTFEVPPTPGFRPVDGSHESAHSPNASSTAIEKLKGIGLTLKLWYGTCEANQVSSGEYAVPEKEGGMYALVFDNTFAKTFSKTATFVLLTYPTDSAPQSNHQVHHFQGTSSGSVVSSKTKTKMKQKLERRRSSDSIPRGEGSIDQVIASSAPAPSRVESSESSVNSNFYTGILQKRRRKRHQGYARRFFSLDFASSTLSYYHNRHTLALRGAVPLSLAAIGANATTREISIDSGAEVWHLRAPNQKEFEAWKKALEAASKQSHMHTSTVNGLGLSSGQRQQQVPPLSPEYEQEWAKVENLILKVSNSRNTARRLAMETDPKYLSLSTSNSIVGSATDLNRMPDMSSADASPTENAISEEYFPNSERRSFWKRKASSARPNPGLFKRSVSAQPKIPSPSPGSLSTSIPTEPVSSSFPRQSQLVGFAEDSLHEQCMRLLRDLDVVVAEFTSLVAESKERRSAPIALVNSRLSLDSQGSRQEFYDAEAGGGSQLFTIQHETDDEVEPGDNDFGTDEHDVSSASEIDDDDSLEMSAAAVSAFPPKPKSLAPLPSHPIKRRTTVPTPTVSPPSLIGFLRKNVGKDLSTISMPVSANEPISLLQKLSEQLEYSSLIDAAADKASTTSLERLLDIAAFAISAQSSLRVKERALRKPFNPMLGETYELVREDRGFRFLAEKVSHRPIKMACQAESEKWSLTQSPIPTQKFWGKSAELITEGRIRVVLHTTGDCFSWTPATCFLRNLIAGEKYVEPVGSLTITNETKGEKAVVTFKTGGMFSGRSEEVSVQMFDHHGDEIPLGLVGKWTQSLCIVENGVTRSKPLWSVGDLVPDAPKCYGFTTFTASLNETTLRDQDKIAPTDSRFRPDQRAVEQGDNDKAELLKGKLEEGQRERRRATEEEGTEWQPLWFVKVEGIEGEEVWKLRSGKDGYWEHRAKGEWKGVPNILAV